MSLDVIPSIQKSMCLAWLAPFNFLKNLMHERACQQSDPVQARHTQMADRDLPVPLQVTILEYPRCCLQFLNVSDTGPNASPAAHLCFISGFLRVAAETPACPLDDSCAVFLPQHCVV